MVRDPVERLISAFYYRRLERTLARHKSRSREWIERDISECVLNEQHECRFINGSSHRGQIFFLCGNEPECLILNSEEGFKRAKHNLENEYAVVGVLEELDKTLAVFEKFIPRFFSKAVKAHFRNLHKLRRMNLNTKKPEVDEKIKELVRKNLTREYEFYELCKKRLNLQFLQTFPVEKKGLQKSSRGGQNRSPRKSE